jgi:hypothetical protein
MGIIGGPFVSRLMILLWGIRKTHWREGCEGMIDGCISYWRFFFLSGDIMSTLVVAGWNQELGRKIIGGLWRLFL